MLRVFGPAPTEKLTRGILILVHHSASLEEPGNMERALRDVGREFDGRVVWGSELMALDVAGGDVRVSRARRGAGAA